MSCLVVLQELINLVKLMELAKLADVLVYKRWQTYLRLGCMAEAHAMSLEVQEPV